MFIEFTHDRFRFCGVSSAPSFTQEFSNLSCLFSPSLPDSFSILLSFPRTNFWLHWFFSYCLPVLHFCCHLLYPCLFGLRLLLFSSFLRRKAGVLLGALPPGCVHSHPARALLCCFRGFGLVVLLFVFVSKYFLISLQLATLTHWQFRGLLFHSYIFVDFPISLFLWTFDFILLWSEGILARFPSF